MHVVDSRRFANWAVGTRRKTVGDKGPGSKGGGKKPKGGGKTAKAGKK